MIQSAPGSVVRRCFNSEQVFCITTLNNVYTVGAILKRTLPPYRYLATLSVIGVGVMWVQRFDAQQQLQQPAASINKPPLRFCCCRAVNVHVHGCIDILTN